MITPVTSGLSEAADQTPLGGQSSTHIISVNPDRNQPEARPGCVRGSGHRDTAFLK